MNVSVCVKRVRLTETETAVFENTEHRTEVGYFQVGFRYFTFFKFVFQINIILEFFQINIILESFQINIILESFQISTDLFFHSTNINILGFTLLIW